MHPRVGRDGRAARGEAGREEQRQGAQAAHQALITSELTLTFRISLHAAVHGWLPIDVAIGRHIERFGASFVLNNPLQELAQSAAALAESGASIPSARLWLEPQWFSLTFAGDGLVPDVAVALLDGRRTLARATVGRRDAARALVGAVRAIADELPRSGRIDGSSAFPFAPFRAAARLLAPAVDRTLPPPWRPLETTQRFIDELAREVGPRHVQHGMDVKVLARHGDEDDYLVELATGLDEYAIVHLTWSGRRETDPRWPATALYGSWGEVSGALRPFRRAPAPPLGSKP